MEEERSSWGFGRGPKKDTTHTSENTHTTPKTQQQQHQKHIPQKDTHTHTHNTDTFQEHALKKHTPVLILSTTLLSTLCFPPLAYSFSFSCPSTSSSMMWGTSTLRTLANEDLGTLAEYDPSTGYEPNDYHISETTEPYIQESSGENGSLNDLEYDDYTIGIALSPPLSTQEREDAASRRRACHSPDEGLSSSQSSSVGHRTGRPVGDQFRSVISSVRENPRRSSENEQIRILLERQREQILADFRDSQTRIPGRL